MKDFIATWLNGTVQVVFIFRHFGLFDGLSVLVLLGCVSCTEEHQKNVVFFTSKYLLVHDVGE